MVHTAFWLLSFQCTDIKQQFLRLKFWKNLPWGTLMSRVSCFILYFIFKSLFFVCVGVCCFQLPWGIAAEQRVEKYVEQFLPCTFQGVNTNHCMNQNYRGQQSHSLQVGLPIVPRKAYWWNLWDKVFISVNFRSVLSYYLGLLWLSG